MKSSDDVPLSTVDQNSKMHQNKNNKNVRKERPQLFKMFLRNSFGNVVGKEEMCQSV